MTKVSSNLKSLLYKEVDYQFLAAIYNRKMKVHIFLVAILALASAGSLSKGEVRRGSQIIRPASQIPIQALLKNTPRKPPTVFKGTPKEVSGCGVSAVSEEDSRIYGGVDAVPNEFPWQALIVVQNDAGLFMGGGSLLTQDWALTAGHLTFGGFSGWIELGSQHRGSIDPGQVNIDLAEIITHPQYQGVDANDIGLVRFVSSAPYTATIRPICLPRYSDFVGGGVPLIISGWGTSGSGSPDILQKATVISMTSAECSATGLGNIDDAKICADGAPGVGTCSGDSGGPLSLVSGGKTYSVGTTSFTVGGCGGSYPDGFVRTTAYLTWISSITGIPIDQ